MRTLKSSPSSPNQPSRFWVGLLASSVVHASLIGGVWLFPEETLKIQAPSQSIRLSLSRIQSAPPPPAPVVEPPKETPPPPPPPKPKEVKKEPPKPKPKPKPKPILKAVDTPLPKEEPPKEEEPIVEETTFAPEPVAAANVSSTIALPEGEVTISLETDRALLEKIYAAILKHKSYPRQAVRMKMEGEVVLEFGLKSDGELSWVKVVRGSGHDLLDGHAMNVLRKAAADFPPPNRRIKVQVPIAYELL